MKNIFNIQRFLEKRRKRKELRKKIREATSIAMKGGRGQRRLIRWAIAEGVLEPVNIFELPIITIIRKGLFSSSGTRRRDYLKLRKMPIADLRSYLLRIT